MRPSHGVPLNNNTSNLLKNIRNVDLDKVPFLQHSKATKEQLGETSLSNYQPKRFGLKYNPPTIGILSI